MNIECPNCKQSFRGEFVAEVPEKQVLFMTLNSESDMIQAATIGKQMQAMSKLLAEIAKNTGATVTVFLHSMECKPKEVKIGFQIVRVK